MSWIGSPFVALLLGTIALTAAPAVAEPKHCYWNAPGLPYSMDPPGNASDAKEGLTPLAVTFALYMNDPGLIAKVLCSNVKEPDLKEARRSYRDFGCSADSSLGRMVEGLLAGGPYVFEGMSAAKFLFDEFKRANPQLIAEWCQVVAGVDYVCFRTAGVVGGEYEQMHREKFPHCVEFYDRFAGMRDRSGGYLEDLYEDLKPEFEELSDADRALLEGSAVK